MKFLLDVCVCSRSLIEHLAGLGHDVLPAAATSPGASDAQLLSLALAQERILITQDKDFGELVFLQRHAHGPVVRMVDLGVLDQIHALDELVDQHVSELQGAAIITISPGRIRIRRAIS